MTEIEEMKEIEMTEMIGKIVGRKMTVDLNAMTIKLIDLTDRVDRIAMRNMIETIEIMTEAEIDLTIEIGTRIMIGGDTIPAVMRGEINEDREIDMMTDEMTEVVRIWRNMRSQITVGLYRPENSQMMAMLRSN